MQTVYPLRWKFANLPKTVAWDTMSQITASNFAWDQLSCVTVGDIANLNDVESEDEADVNAEGTAVGAKVNAEVKTEVKTEDKTEACSPVGPAVRTPLKILKLY